MRRITVYVFFETLQQRSWGFLSSGVWRGMAGQMNSDFSRQRVFLLRHFAPWPWGKTVPRIFFIRLPCDAASYPRRTGSYIYIYIYIYIYSCNIYCLQSCTTDFWRSWNRASWYISIAKPTRYTTFKFIEYHVFRTVFPSIIKSSRLYTQHLVYVIQFCWLHATVHASMQSTNLYDIYLMLCVQSWTLDDGRKDRPKHVSDIQ